MAVRADWARRVARASDSFTRSESTLLRFITANPQDAAFMSLKELCEETAVSKPKAIEFYRKLGYHNFREFREGVLEFYEHHIDSYRASRTTFRQVDELSSLMNAAVQVDSNSLVRMQEHVSTEDLRELAENILGAGELFVFGPGTGRYPASFLCQRLKRYRLHVHMVELDMQHLAEELYPLGEGDLLLVFYYAQDHDLVRRVMEFAKSQGATVVVITGSILLDFVQVAHRVVYVERGEMGFKNSMAVPMSFANLLLLSVEFLAGEGLQEKLKALEERREQFGLTRAP